MNVILAKSAGFCFGVKRALETVDAQVEKGKKPIYTYGPIIHNEIVVSDLEEKGVHVLPEDEPLATGSFGTVVIRSHGVSRNVKQSIEDSGYALVDATCPFVLKIHKVVEEYGKEGYFILITGDESHPEVQGIIGWIPEGTSYAVISSEEEAKNFSLKEKKKICMVSQTTFQYNKFEELVEIIKQKGYDVFCLNTICSATEERQKEAASIAGKVDVMIVIGGKHSSNSQKLYEICKKRNPQTYFIQSRHDLDLSVLQSINTVGITAGASTPQKIIQEVQETCQNRNRALRRC